MHYLTRRLPPAYWFRMMVNLGGQFLIILLLGTSTLLGQQEVNLVWESEAPVYQESWFVELRVENTVALSTAQFGLVWENEDLILENVNLGAGFSNAVTNEQASAFNFSWVSTAAEGLLLTEGTLVMRMNFSLLPCPQDSVGISWNNDGLPPQFTAWANDSLVLLPTVLMPLEEQITPPVLWTATDTIFCSGESLLLDAACTDCTAWEWSNGTSESSLLLTAPGIYSVRVEDNRACFFTDTIEVEVLSLPEIQLRDTVICKEDTLQLEIPALAGAVFLWSTGDTLPSITLTQAGQYELTITNIDGCQQADTLTLALRDPVLTTFFLDPMTGCIGDTLTISVDGPDSLTWLHPQVMGPNEQGDFSFIGLNTLTELALVGIDECGNDTVRTDAVFYQPMGYAMTDTCITPGSKVTLEAFNGKSYTWSHPLYDVSPYDQAIGTSAPLDTATYVVEILDENGCISVDSVYVAIANDPLAFIRPINFISPNQDGHNDVLEFTGLEKYTNNDLIVWNRWNQVVYHKEQYQQDEERFVGQMNQKDLPDGIYYYQLRVDEVIIEQQLILLRHGE